jgi:hypothetical protein
MTRGGLPHSDIPGSKLVCSSPGLFAACHVLHRLLAPRHSPYTLSSLTIKLKTDAHQTFAYQLVCDSFFRNTACVCGRKKLPCAEYSVVKDQLEGFAPNRQLGRFRGASKPRSALSREVRLQHLPKANLLTSARHLRSALNLPDVGARETQQPHSLTETFSAVALRALARQARTCAVISNICRSPSSRYGAQPSLKLACQP